MDLEHTLVSPLCEQGEDESEFTITRVADDGDWATTKLGSTMQIEIEDLAATRRRPAPAAFDRDARFAMDRDSLERIHAAIDDALAGAPHSSVPSVDVGRAQLFAPIAPVAMAAPARVQTTTLQAVLAVACTLTALVGTAAAVITLVT